VNNTNRESDNPDSDSKYSLSTSTNLEQEQGGNLDTKITEGSNIKLVNLVNS
jgi:hypothetical protein